MKEATGELNATIIVVVAVSVLMAFFYYTLWPILRSDLDSKSKCSKAICEPCTDTKGLCDYVECHLSGKESEKFQCVYKG